jgi:hypothetical protein
VWQEFFGLCGLIYVAMKNLDAFSCGFDMVIKGAGNGYGAVPASGASDSDG